MAIQGFYADNEARHYPFRGPGPGLALPTTAIVDFGAVLYGDEVGFVDYAPSVAYLIRVLHAGGNLVLSFGCSSPSTTGTTLDFVVPDDAEEFAVAEAAVPRAALDVTGAEPGDLWDGYLVVGHVAALAALVPDGEFVECYLMVEPTLVRDAARRALRLINVGNLARDTLPGAASSSSSSAGPPEDPETIVHPIRWGDAGTGRGLRNAVGIVAGYNLQVRHDTRTNAIVFAPRVGAGEGQPCGEVPRYPGEAPPRGSALLSGGPTCAEVIHVINGLSGESLNLQGGPGVTITPDPARPNALVIDLDVP